MLVIIGFGLLSTLGLISVVVSVGKPRKVISGEAAGFAVAIYLTQLAGLMYLVSEIR